MRLQPLPLWQPLWQPLPLPLPAWCYAAESASQLAQDALCTLAPAAPQHVGAVPHPHPGFSHTLANNTPARFPFPRSCSPPVWESCLNRTLAVPTSALDVDAVWCYPLATVRRIVEWRCG